LWLFWPTTTLKFPCNINSHESWPTRVKLWTTSDSANHPVPRDLAVQIQCMPHLTCEASTACEVCATLQPIFCDYLSGTISPNLVSVTTAQIDLLHSFAAYTPMSSNSAIPFKPMTIPKRGWLNCLFLVLHLRQRVMIEWGPPVGLLALAIYWSQVVDHRCKTCCYIEEGSTGVEQWCARWWYDSIHNLVILQMTYHDLTTYLNREKSIIEEIKPILQSAN